MTIQAFHRFLQNFLVHGISPTDLSSEQLSAMFLHALAHANLELSAQGVVVFFHQQIPERGKGTLINPQFDLLLGVKTHEEEYLIDIFNLQALDEISIKPTDILTKEIVQKTQQHLAARKIEGIFISTSGSKFDTRKLTNHNFEIDNEGYTRINQHRITLSTTNGYAVMKAESLRSYTILRFVEEDDAVRIFDEHDLVRLNNRGMKIDFTIIYQYALSELAEKSQADAKTYEGKYLGMERDELTIDIKTRLYHLLVSFDSN